MCPRRRPALIWFAVLVCAATCSGDEAPTKPGARLRTAPPGAPQAPVVALSARISTDEDTPLLVRVELDSAELLPLLPVAVTLVIRNDRRHPVDLDRWAFDTELTSRFAPGAADGFEPVETDPSPRFLEAPRSGCPLPAGAETRIFTVLDLRTSERAVLETPGTFALRRRYGERLSDPVELVVGAPTGREGDAYDFVRHNRLTPWIASIDPLRFPVTGEVAARLEEILERYPRTAYADRAMLALAGGWFAGVDGVTDPGLCAALLARIVDSPVAETRGAARFLDWQLRARDGATDFTAAAKARLDAEDSATVGMFRGSRVGKEEGPRRPAIPRR